MKSFGYDKPLYILPFDHRQSFQTKLFGWTTDLTPDQAAQIVAAKQVIYDGFKAATRLGAPEQWAGILTDQQFDRIAHRYLEFVQTFEEKARAA